ncbi:carbohydrate ABC transporter permease [Paenibacillus chondroitinus]|uniref:Carbohydrate ABC transporter permease n=1 Tax=Paenibacillus chondroitinus TaxID=59842 RepID=A0ABU6DCM8_9BACL|nr:MULTISPECIES: carbohydrate ABC transporter permease [Paenibacillus]MCY9659872.1 carbohydrate ABC transporter permease [Paenibacillus anseongense]MEB4795510.1 carbohydrate ABC transporter permease [Paenibacillus chondroitinus]
MIQNPAEKIGNTIIILLLGIFCLFCVVPMIHIFALSLSGNRAIMSGEVTLWPIDLNFEPYKNVFGDMSMIRSLLFTIWLVVGYTIVSLIATILAAYPLSRRNFKGKNILFALIIITMFFNPGIIPNYLLIKELHMLNSVWSLVLPLLINAFLLIILKTSFTQLPAELEDSAWMDGCGHFRYLMRIVLPLSLPILATLALYSAVDRWNMFQDALFFINDSNLYPIQQKLYEIVINSQVNDATAQEGFGGSAPVPESLQAASIMFATVPILLVYPWLQRYFISGMLVGAVKG